jgi:hypothetical protein
MWEKEQVDYWETQSNGYIAPLLPAWKDNPIWTSEPKVTTFRDVLKRSLDDGYSRKLSRASAVVMGDFVVASSGASVATQIGFQPLFQANDGGDCGSLAKRAKRDHERERAFAESTSRHATAGGATDGFLDAVQRTARPIPAR